MFWLKIYIIVIQIFSINEIISAEKINSTQLKSEYFRYNSILFGLTNIAPETNVNNQCKEDLETLRTDLLKQRIWAMKMIDSSGQKSSGFLFGQNHWLGDYDICRVVQSPLKLLISENHERNMYYGLLNETAPYDVNFNVIYLHHNSPWQVEVKAFPLERTIEIGLCVPKSCKVEDLFTLMELYIESDIFVEKDIYELNLKILNIKNIDASEWPLKDPVVVTVLCVHLCTIIMIAFAAILRKLLNSDYNSTLSKNILEKFLLQICRFISCYDVKSNASKLFNINSSSNGEILIISGLRSIAAFVIIWLHVGFYSYPILTNKPFLVAFGQNNGTIFAHTVVDVFFTISGFLQVYKFLSNSQQTKLIRDASISCLLKEFFHKLFHRLLRLAPLYFLIIGLDVALYTLVKSISLYHVEIRDDLLFKVHWWRYLTFTQNFLTASQLLANWTWSMACEMQFFTFGTLMLFLYVKRPKIAKFIFVLFFLGSISAHYYNGIKYSYGFNHDDFLQSVTEMYLNPYVRCMPYLVGGVIGWYLANKSQQMSYFTERIIGNTAFVLVAAVFSPLSNRKIPSSAIAVSMLLVTRISLSIWYGWLIVAAVTKRRTWLTDFLEMKFFRHYGRLSYAIYLTNPLIIVFVSSMTNVGVHIENFLGLITCWGFVTITYIASIVLSLAFEIPYCNISTLLLKGK